MSPAPGRGASARTWRVLAWTGAGIVALALLALVALRLALAQLPDNAPRIQAWIERQTNLRLEFATVDARLRWWGPEAVLRDVRVLDRDATQALFETREATVSLDVWNLFRTGELVAGRVSFVRPAVTVVRLPDGRIRLLGQRERPSEQPLFDLDRLPAGRLEIADATVRFEDRLAGRGPWVLRHVQLSLRRARRAVDVAGSAQLPADFGTRVRFEGRLRGSLDRFADLDARLDLQAERLELEGFAQFLPARAGRPAGGNGPATVALGVGQGGLQQLRVAMDFSDVVFDLPVRALPPVETVTVSEPYREAGAAPLSLPVVDKSLVQRPAPALPRQVSLARISGGLRLRREGDGWTFRASDLVVQRKPGDRGRPARIEGQWTGHPASAFALRLDADGVRLADLWPLALVAAPAGFDRWAGLDPAGEVQSLGIDLLRERAGSEPRFTLSAKVAGLSARPTGRGPGLSGLTASLSGTEQRGRIALHAEALSLEWPRLFRAPIELTRADGEIDWSRDGSAWVFSGRQISLAHEAASAVGDLELRLGRGRDLPFLVATARVERADAAAVRRFLPVGRLSPDTIAWLEQAFGQGRVSDGRLSYRGPVRRFPFRGGEGEFVASAAFRDLALNYFPGFEPLTGAAGRVEFRNASTRASLEEGSVGGLRLDRAAFELADYREPVIDVSAGAAGDIGRTLELLQRSPLGAELGAQFMELAGQGPADYSLDLSIPTQKPSAHRFTVRTRLHSATLRWPVLREPVTRLGGELEITEGSIRADALRGTYLGGPFELRARPGPKSPDLAMSVVLDGEGRAGGAQLPGVIGLPVGIRMSGAGAWKLRGRLDRPAARGSPWPVRLELASDMTGLGIDAPRPFAKAPIEPRPTRVVVDLPRPGRNDLRIESGAARAVLEFERRADQRWILERGAARFDGQPVSRPSRPGLHVAGDWPEFDLGEWLALRSASPGGPTLSDWLGPVDVHLDRAQLIGFEFRDVTAHMQPLAGAWRIQVGGPMAEGVITVPEDLTKGEPIDLQMQRLRLQPPAGQGPGDPPTPETDPRELPGIRLRAQDFVWQGRRFGRLDADVQRDPRGLRLEGLATESGDFALRATGSWYAEDSGSRTRLTLDFSTSDLAAASRALGYREAVEAARASARAEVTWSGGPDANVIARMDGTLHLDLGRGQLRGVDPGAGRMLGLLSVVELPRRLSLDFRDVTNEGLAFDTVRGDFEIRAGNAHTQNLLLEGAAVDVGVVGRTGLATQDYDQTIVVSGNPSGPITIAGALAGGPVGAAGALLFSQLFKGQLQGLARVYYRVTGPWANPVVERISASVGSGLVPGKDDTPEQEPPP